MTDATVSPWANHMPQVQAEHTMPMDQFTASLTAAYEDIHGRTCCPEHGARVAVMAAVACLMEKHRGNVDAIEQDLAEIHASAMANVRDGFIRWTGG